ncbi:class I SAM-dependent methyltransferase [Halobacterium noricense]|uniref:Class I SAM-dependent methyltransferase n=2 Tax=Haladaptatus pallidirubidus TaxID=1008152 RepID=A0AAV3UJN8_9EURY
MTGKDKRAMAEWVLSELAVEPTDRILEVGFGPGLGIEVASAATSDGFVAGIDYSHEMVEMARKRNAAAVETGHVDLRYGSADEIPSEDAVFDTIFSINSMQVWPDAAAGLKEMRRVLKPGGRIAVAFTPIAGQSQDELRPLLTRVGFDDIRVEKQEIGICAIAEKHMDS